MFAVQYWVSKRSGPVASLPPRDSPTGSRYLRVDRVGPEVAAVSFEEPDRLALVRAAASFSVRGLVVGKVLQKNLMVAGGPDIIPVLEVDQVGH